MFAFRHPPVAVLLLAWFSGQAAIGLVLAHVASDHAVSERHGEHQAAHHHAAHHHAAHHDAAHHRAVGEHHHAEHGSEHAHQITPTTVAPLARGVSPSTDARPCLAVVGQGRFERPAPTVLSFLPLPVPRAGPPELQRHPILLL